MEGASHMKPDVPGVGFLTKLALIIVFLESAPIWIGHLAGYSKPLGVDPETWLKLTTATVLALIVARGVQAAFGIYAAHQRENPAFGVSTIVGLAVGLLEMVPTVLQDLAASAGPLGIDPGVWTTAGTSVGIAILLSRGLQSGLVTLNSVRAAVDGPHVRPSTGWPGDPEEQAEYEGGGGVLFADLGDEESNLGPDGGPITPTLPED